MNNVNLQFSDDFIDICLSNCNLAVNFPWKILVISQFNAVIEFEMEYINFFLIARVNWFTIRVVVGNVRLVMPKLKYSGNSYATISSLYHP